MYISALFYVGVLLIGMLGVYIFYKNLYRTGMEYIRFKKLWKRKLVREIKIRSNWIKNINSNDDMFIKLFNLVRYIIPIGFVIYFTINDNLTYMKIGVLIVIYIFMQPVKKIFNYQTLYGKLYSYRKNMHKRKIDIDLFYCMTRLKNLCCSQKENSVSSSYLIEMLVRDSGCTHLAFSKLLFIWRLGRKQEACEMFAEQLNTKMAYEFSKIILKLDELSPKDMVERIEIYQNHIREEKMTQDIRRQEVISYILYMPIMASAFCILLNFLIVVVVMDTMRMLQSL